MAAAPSNRLLSGHDEEFARKVEDDFKCLICHLTLKHPVQTRCGHRFCKECLEEHFRRQEVQAQNYTCPADREVLDRDRVQRKNVELHIQSDMREHLDFACLKINNTQAQLNNTQVQLSLTENIFQETTRNLEEKVEALQKQLEKKEIKDPGNGYTRFVWKIDKFSEIWSQAKAEVKKAISSASFCTESYGYRLKVKVLPNGIKTGKNTHLSVAIVVMKGEYDAILPWPFNKKVKFTLIDQQEDTQNQQNVVHLLKPNPSNKRDNFARPKGVENDGYGPTMFISHEKLQTRRYLVDDTLFLQVEVGEP